MDNWAHVRIKNAVALSQTHNSRGTRVSLSWTVTASARRSEVDTFSIRDPIEKCYNFMYFV